MYICRGTYPIPDGVALPYDLIVAADCTYLESTYDLLISTLIHLTTSATGIPTRTEVLLASKKRRRADKTFWIKLKKKFIITDVCCTLLYDTIQSM